MEVFLLKCTWHGRLILWISVIQWTQATGQGITQMEYTKPLPQCLSLAAPSEAFVVAFLECLLNKTLFSLFTIFKPGIWMCQKTELLSGAKIQWILFTVCVAAIENGIHSSTEVKSLQQQEVVEVKAAGAGRGAYSPRLPTCRCKL